MVHLNKTELTSSQKKELLAQLNDTLGTLRKSQTNSFLSELLGKEERVMLAKRLAAIILLQEGASLYKVSEVLKISSSTAQNLRQKLDDGGFEQTMHILGKSKKGYREILETLDQILQLGGILPHYSGASRYTVIKKHY